MLFVNASNYSSFSDRKMLRKSSYCFCAIVIIWMMLLAIMNLSFLTQTCHHRTGKDVFENLAAPSEFQHFHLNVVSDMEQDLVNKSTRQNRTETLKLERPLLTLFTTLKDLPERRIIHNHTFINWGAFKPYIQPVLYVESDINSQISHLAKRNGWIVKQAPELRENLPVIRTMFKDAIGTFNSDFYGFANADMLFDFSIVSTLQMLKPYVPKLRKGFLISGQRKNILYARIKSPEPDQLYKIKTKGRMYSPLAQDYFITTSNGYPWHRLPDFVVGRPGWDNWIVLKSFQWRLSFIDATKTILALHQTGLDGNSAGFQHDDKDVNLKIVGNFTWELARTTCARYATATDITGSNSFLYARVYLGEECHMKRLDTNTSTVV